MNTFVKNCSSCQGDHEVVFEDMAWPDHEGFSMQGRCPVTGVELLLSKNDKSVFKPFTTIYQEGDEVYQFGWGPVDPAVVGKRNDKAIRRKRCLKSETTSSVSTTNSQPK